MTITRKVGLMYPSDYGYAAENNYWPLSLYSYDANAKNENWLYMNETAQWVIYRRSDSNARAFHVNYAGRLYSNSIYNEYAIRPVFYLKPSVIYVEGVGTIEEPIKVAYKETAANTIKDLYNGQETPSGNGFLYWHDNTLTNGAEDNSVRYSGKNPDNYVCFAGAACSNQDNLYRIIGVFNNQVKLIKHKDIGKMNWNSEGTNIWRGSTSDIYLNDTYLNSLADKGYLISESIWNVGGVYSQGITAKKMFDEEMAMKATYTCKIGLMYISDYMFAAGSSKWTLVGYNSDSTKDYRSATSENWLYYSGHQWTISTNGNKDAYSVVSYGNVYHNYVAGDNRAIRPAFYLSQDTRIIDGDGTIENPYIISQ